MFSERVDVDADSKLIERLILGRKRAAGLLSAREKEEDDNVIVGLKIEDEPKPN